MMVLERRVQMLIDHDRYALLEREAERTGESVAAVIRLAIDRLLATAPSVRAMAATSLLADVNGAPEVAVEWSDAKRAITADLDRRAR